MLSHNAVCPPIDTEYAKVFKEFLQIGQNIVVNTALIRSLCHNPNECLADKIVLDMRPGYREPALPIHEAPPDSFFSP